MFSIFVYAFSLHPYLSMNVKSLFRYITEQFQTFICLILDQMYWLRLYWSYKLIKWVSTKCQFKQSPTDKLQFLFSKIINIYERQNAHNLLQCNVDHDEAGSGTKLCCMSRQWATNSICGGSHRFHRGYGIWTACGRQSKCSPDGKIIKRTFQQPKQPVQTPDTCWELWIIRWSTVRLEGGSRAWEQTDELRPHCQRMPLNALLKSEQWKATRWLG